MHLLLGMYIFRGYVGFREGNTKRHFLRSTSARALGTRQAKSFCVELPVQLHGRLYDLGQHCPHRRMSNGQGVFSAFCQFSLLFFVKPPVSNARNRRESTNHLWVQNQIQRIVLTTRMSFYETSGFLEKNHTQD